MTNHRVTRLVALGALVAAGSAAAPSMAGAATGGVNVTARCSGSSHTNLQVQREDTGALSVDFGVDMARHKSGVAWNVTGADNGTTFVHTVARTGRDGSFSITTVLTPPAGANTVVSTAINPATGERCTVAGSL
jgi:hypothetical protein